MVQVSSFHLFLKRSLDIVGSVLGLCLSIPLIFCLGLAIKVDSPGPIFFGQERVGWRGRPFKFYKLRSMYVNAEQKFSEIAHLSPLPGFAVKVPQDPRMTRVGRWLRRWSLDELPQFWHVLRGEMSLVGPRPEQVSVVEQYSDWHRQRLAVKPGLTGPMQINGRGLLSLDERVVLELDYIEHYSIWRDLHILLMTIPAWLSGRGAF